MYRHFTQFFGYKHKHFCEQDTDEEVQALQNELLFNVAEGDEPTEAQQAPAQGSGPQEQQLRRRVPPPAYDDPSSVRGLPKKDATGYRYLVGRDEIPKFHEEPLSESMEECSCAFFAQRQHPYTPSGSSSSAKLATHSSLRYVGALKHFGAVHVSMLKLNLLLVTYMHLFFSCDTPSLELKKADDSKSTLTSQPTTSDEEMHQEFFGKCGEKPVGQDIAESNVTGPCVVLMPAPLLTTKTYLNMSICL